MGKEAQRLQVPLDAAMRGRIVGYISNVGFGPAAKRLGVGRETLDVARTPGGALGPNTIAKIVAGLERECISEAS